MQISRENYTACSDPPVTRYIIRLSPHKQALRKTEAGKRKSAARPVTVGALIAKRSDSRSNLSSVDQIVSEIVRGLYEGTYVAGQKLIETDLTRQFSVARSTVREALRRLAAEGLVTVSLYRGARIRSLSRGEVRDMLEVIAALAGLSARLAAERISDPEHHQALRDTLHRLSMLAPADAPFEFARERNRLYRQLAHFSGNAELARLVPLLQAHLIRVQFQVVYGSGSDKKTLQYYTAIVNAVLKHDGVRAERAVRDHIRDTANAIEKLPDQYFAL